MSVEELNQEQSGETATVVDTQAQPEPVAPETADPQEAKQPDATAGDQADRDEKGRFKGVQPRIDELTRKRHEAEREAAYWRGVATQGKVPTSADQPAAPDKPTPDKFDDHNAYVEALVEWKADQKIAQAMAASEAQAAQKQQAQARTTTWTERQAAARATMPDYDQVVGESSTPIASHVAESIMESEHGPALAYHFAKHPDILERLNSMPARQADREIGRLEERFTSKVADAPVKTSNAPKPASVSSTQGRSNTPSLQTASMDEYVRQRKAQGARWAR